MRTTKALAAAALAITALLTVSACGSTGASGNGVADKSAEEILAATQAAAKAETSVHMVGTVTQDAGDMTIDMKVEKGGKAVGTIVMAGATLDIISTGTKVYVKGDKAFWDSQAGEGAYELIGDKWVASTSDKDLESFKDFTDFTTAVSQMLTPSGTLSKTEPSTVDGQAVIGLQDGEKGTLWVATTGDPLPLKIDGGSEGGVTFSDWGATVTITEPAAADVLDPSQIGQ
jgi:outer membrane lipoprotein-sorting protein